LESYISLKVFNDGVLNCVLFLWNKSIVYYIQMRPQCLKGWLCLCVQVIKPTLLGLLEGDNPNLWTMPSGLSISSGPNRFYDLNVGPKLASETSWLHFEVVRDGVRPEKQQ
jgi:hypothetical protein